MCIRDSRNIPQNLKSPENKWFALSKRSRIIVTSKDRVKEGQITKIEDLADEQWKGRVCSRPGSHVYNRALMASLILSLGEKAAEEWAKKFVGNLARRPQGNDRAQVKAIFEGQCDISIINNYYFGKLKYSFLFDSSPCLILIIIVISGFNFAKLFKILIVVKCSSFQLYFEFLIHQDRKTNL